MTLLTSDPRLSDCRRLFLREHAIDVHIGVHDFEKTAPQRVIFNVELYVPLALSTPKNDSLDEVVDYDFIRTAITVEALWQPAASVSRIQRAWPS